MKISRFKPKISHGLIVSSLALTAFLGLASLAFADEDSPDQLRDRAENLLRKAQELKAQGAGDEANKLAQEAEDLQRSAKKASGDRGPQRRESNNPNPDKQERAQQLRKRLEAAVASGNMEGASKLKQEMADLERSQGPKDKPQQQDNPKARLGKMQQEIASLHDKGQHEEAQRLEERARGLREKLMAGGQPREFRPDQPRFSEPGRGPGPGPGPQFNGPQFNGRMQEPPRGQPFPSPGPQGQPQMQPQRQPQGDMGNRLNHIQVAIENLHAAGLHENANRLAQEAERLQRQNREQRQPRMQRPNQRNGDGDVQSLRGEINELRQAVQELRRQLDEMRPRR